MSKEYEDKQKQYLTDSINSAMEQSRIEQFTTVLLALIASETVLLVTYMCIHR